MNNGFVFLIAGEPGESKVAIAQKIAGDYALGFMEHYPSNVLWRTNDVIICDTPEDVIEAKKSYRGYSDILTILVSDMRHKEWEGTNDIADLVVDPDDPEIPATMIVKSVAELIAEKRLDHKLWLSTDPDTVQYIRVVDRNQYECLQLTVTPNGRYGISEGFINLYLGNYTNEDLDSEIGAYGYTVDSLMRNFKDMDAWRMIAECIFENEALDCIVEEYSSFAEAKDHLEKRRRRIDALKPVAYDDVNYTNDANETTQWQSYSDERELWLRPVDSVIAPTEFEVVRAAPSFMRYGEYAFSHRFVHLGGYDLHNEDDVRILNRDGNMDETVFESCDIDDIMLDKNGKPDRIEDPRYILDYWMLAAMIADNEDGAQYMSEDHAMRLVDKIVGKERWQY